MTKETLPNVANSVDVHSYRIPLGVCAGIAPFNFPAMIPLWMFPPATTAGNTFLMKPSERVPLSARSSTFNLLFSCTMLIKSDEDLKDLRDLKRSLPSFY